LFQKGGKGHERQMEGRRTHHAAIGRDKQSPELPKSRVLARIRQEAEGLID